MTVLELMDALADQIETGLADIEQLQVDGRLIPDPSPPAIDIYPADPFTERIGWSAGSEVLRFTVRARVSTADNEAGQDTLLALMDPQTGPSVESVILADDDLGGRVSAMVVTGPSGFGLFPVPAGSGMLLGCTWTVEVTL